MTRKTIALPGHPDLDIQPILPIVTSELFQRLTFIRQLGTCFFTFPSAHHTRFEHSLGAYSLMVIRVRNWLSDGMINEHMAINLKLLSLLHDIGHGPYSHATEILCKNDHNKHGLFLISELRQEIENCGGDMETLYELFNRVNSFWKANGHRPLGTDKLDYTARDNHYTTNAAGFRRDDMINHVYWINGTLVADAKIVRELMSLQLAYINMHDRVYFRKACIITQYFLQQIVALALKTGDIKQSALPNMTDSDLDACLLYAKDPTVRTQFKRLRNRELPKTAISLRAEETLTHDENSGKSIQVFRMPMSELQKFSIFNHRNTATSHEEAIAKIAGIPPQDVLLTPVVSPERFTPHDISVYDNTQVIGTLKEFYPNHYESMNEIAIGYGAVRVCVAKQYRERVASPRIAAPIYDYLIQLI